MICTEDNDYHQIEHEWNLNNCNVVLMDVILSTEYTIVCDMVIDGTPYYEEMFQEGITNIYGAYTVTCSGFIGTDLVKMAQITICTDAEANQTMTLYFKPYPWSSNNIASSLLANKSIELAGGFANAFASISNNEYIGHEIVVERPDFSGIDLVGVRIYVYSTVVPTTPQFAFGGLGIAAVLLVVALLGGCLAYVGNKWQDIIATWTYKHPLTVIECNETYSDNVVLRIENGCYKVNNGEISEDEFIVLLRDIVKENHAHRNMISAKNTPLADDAFELRIENAIAQYNIDGNFDALCTSSKDAAQTRATEDKAETGNNYIPGDMPDLSNTLDEWLTYLMYGGIALGGILLATTTTQLISTIKK